MRLQFFALLLVASLGSVALEASVITFGDEDCLGTGCYGANDPTAGATVQGLAPDAITLASMAFAHNYPFGPSPGDFPGTDTIYVGSTQTNSHDGYSSYSGRVNGPQVLTLDYSSLIPVGQTLTTLTLGIAADDFQFPSIGQPFTATVNGTVDAALTTQLNALDQSGPIVQYFTIGINPGVDAGNHILTLSIDEGGDGGDGWAVDFLTIGVTTTGATSTTPEPSTLAMLALGGLGMLAARRVRPRRRTPSF